MILVACVILGVVLGVICPFYIPQMLSKYVAIVILALLDSVLGGISSMVRKRFDIISFLLGFVVNAILALALTFIGEKLGADLFLVGLIVFGTRIFNNFTVIRRLFLSEFKIKLKK